MSQGSEDSCVVVS